MATEQPLIDDIVDVTPDTTPSCDPSQSFALYGLVVDLKFESELMVKIKSSYYGRDQLWVSETRVNSTSKSIIDNSII